MLFTTITVCYNASEIIRMTLDSVLAQEFRDYEYVVVDGGSKDGTVDILKEYEPKFEGRMRFISEPDKGIYDAMNKAVDMAKGEYLNFLNAGDYYEPETLKIVSEAIENAPDYDVYYGITRLFDSRGEVILRRSCHDRLCDGKVINHQAIWYGKSVFARCGKYDTFYKICADYDHQLTLFQNSCRFRPIDAVVVNYDNTGVSVKAGVNGQFIREQNRIMWKHGYMKEADFIQFIKSMAWYDFCCKVSAFFDRICVTKVLRKLYFLTLRGIDKDSL